MRPTQQPIPAGTGQLDAYSVQQGQPELELSDKQTGTIRYIEHGCPSWRIRWHYHDEYELHFIAASRGKVFIGDYIGSFEPGNLILTGPFLPHNWISQVTPGESCELRDQIIHFDHDVIMGIADLVPEMQGLMPLLERSRYGIEFIDQTELAEHYMAHIKRSTGVARLGYFCQLMDALASCSDYRLLSTEQIRLPADEALQERINRVVNYVMQHYQNSISLAEVATLVNMSESYFSRFFRKATGNRFSDFINRIRISKACELLAHTDQYITTICYDVGFNNVANFNRRFIEHKRVTPSDYRKQTRQRYRSQQTL